MSDPKNPERARAVRSHLLPNDASADEADHTRASAYETQAGGAAATPSTGDHDERFLDAIYEDVGTFLVDRDDRFPELDTLENELRVLQFVADLQRIVHGDVPPPPQRPPARLPDRVVMEQRTVLLAAMVRCLSNAEHPDLAALVAAYDRGLTGNKAAIGAGLNASRHADAMVRLKHVLDTCHQLSREPERFH
jgi:hypothetical protein